MVKSNTKFVFDSAGDAFHNASLTLKYIDFGETVVLDVFISMKND